MNDDLKTPKEMKDEFCSFLAALGLAAVFVAFIAIAYFAMAGVADCADVWVECLR